MCSFWEISLGPQATSCWRSGCPGGSRSGQMKWAAKRAIMQVQHNYSRRHWASQRLEKSIG